MQELFDYVSSQWWSNPAALLAVIFYVWAAWWGLFSDNARGKRRCPKCWYDLSHTEGLRCAECGHAAKRERHLRRRRRRWLPALASIFCAVVLGVYWIDSTLSKNITAYLPDSALVWYFNVINDNGASARRELEQRMVQNSLSIAQQKALIDACTQRTGNLQPPSSEWESRFGDLLTNWSTIALRHGDASLREHTREALRTLPPRVEIDLPGPWPRDVEPVASVHVRTWPAAQPQRITITPLAPGGEAQTFEMRRAPIQRRSFSLALPALDPEVAQLEFRVETSRPDDDDAWRDVDEQIVSASVQTCEATRNRFELVSGEALDDIMRRVFAGGVIKWSGGGELPVRITVNRRETWTSEFDDVAVGARVEILRNGNVARMLDIWWMGGSLAPRSYHTWDVPFHDDDLLGAPNSPDDVWEARVSSDPALALRVPDATKCWSGVFRMEIPVRPQEGKAPPRGWISVPEAREAAADTQTLTM